MNIYAISINDNMNEKNLRYWLEKISEIKKEKVNKYKFIDDKKRSIYGELILRYALISEMGIKNEKIIVDVDVNGKPYLKNNSHIFFNISHSGEYVICVVDRHPIGVDIELIGKADIAVAKKVFTLNERKQIFAREEDENTLFYQFWTLKECYAKYKGMGLRLPFNSFSFVLNDGAIKMETIKAEVYFLSIIFLGQYYISICTEENHELGSIKQLSIGDLIAM